MTTSFLLFAVAAVRSPRERETRRRLVSHARYGRPEGLRYDGKAKALRYDRQG